MVVNRYVNVAQSSAGSVRSMWRQRIRRPSTWWTATIFACKTFLECMHTVWSWPIYRLVPSLFRNSARNRSTLTLAVFDHFCDFYASMQVICINVNKGWTWVCLDRSYKNNWEFEIWPWIFRLLLQRMYRIIYIFWNFSNSWISILSSINKFYVKNSIRT